MKMLFGPAALLAVLALPNSSFAYTHFSLGNGIQCSASVQLRVEASPKCHVFSHKTDDEGFSDIYGARVFNTRVLVDSRPCFNSDFDVTGAVAADLSKDVSMKMELPMQYSFANIQGTNIPAVLRKSKRVDYFTYDPTRDSKDLETQMLATIANRFLQSANVTYNSVTHDVEIEVVGLTNVSRLTFNEDLSVGKAVKSHAVNIPITDFIDEVSPARRAADIVFSCRAN